jgi:anti-anti-sigma regulatory factor
MAFSLFTRQLAKPKPMDLAAGGAVRGRGPGLPDQGSTRPDPTGAKAAIPDFATTQRLILSDDWNPRHSRIEVSDSAPGLTPILENAALLFANGQSETARAVLEDGLRADRETQRAVLAWLALFDLLQRLDDRATFEQVALHYVVAFERSAPMWDESRRSLAVARPAASAGVPGRMVALIGELNHQSEPQVDALVRATESQSLVRLDVSALAAVTNEGAQLLTDALRDLRRRGVLLHWQGLERLRGVLEGRVTATSASDEGCWLLLLEALQWQGDQNAFEERAVEYAITFELSPPSWEPPAVSPPEIPVEGSEPQPVDDTSEVLAMTGMLCGPADAQVGRLYDFANGRDHVLVDMAAVDRIDFVCAGSFYNAIQQLQRRDAQVHIAGASAIIRALLLLIGVPPRHFAKRAQ